MLFLLNRQANQLFMSYLIFKIVSLQPRLQACKVRNSNLSCSLSSPRLAESNQVLQATVQIQNRRTIVYYVFSQIMSNLHSTVGYSRVSKSPFQATAGIKYHLCRLQWELKSPLKATAAILNSRCSLQIRILEKFE